MSTNTKSFRCLIDFYLRQNTLATRLLKYLPFGVDISIMCLLKIYLPL